VVRRNGSGGCAVKVVFKKGEAEYQVARYRNHSTFQNRVVFKVKLNEEAEPLDISGSSIRETEAKIVAELGFSFDIFKNTICHGQGLPYRFAQATDAEKKEIFDEILDLSWIADTRERVRRTIMEYDKKLEKVRNRVSENRLRLEMLREQVDEVKERGKNDLDEDESVPVDTEALQQEVEVCKKAISECRKKVEGISRREKREEEKKVAASKRVAEMRYAIGVMEKEKRAFEEVMKKNEKMVGKPCPTCGRLIGKDTLDKFVDIKRRAIEVVAKKLEKEKRQYAAVSRLSKQIEKSLTTLRREKMDLEIEIREQEERRMGFQEKLAGAEARKRERRKQRRVREKEIKEKVDRIEKDMNEVLEKIAVLEDMETLYKSVKGALEFWLEGFSNRGIKSLVLDNVIPFLNTTAAMYSSALMDGRAQIRFNTQRETSKGELRDKFVVEVSNESGSNYNQSSGGEKRRVDVVVLLTLHDLIARQSGVDTNFQIFDEVVENLDATGTERLLELLRIRSEERGIYVISHDSELASHFDSYIKVRKNRSGVSSIEGG